jgi:hypothetical protein
MAVGNRRADRATPLYPQKLSLTSLASSGRSVGIVRSRTKATELVFFLHDGITTAQTFLIACVAMRKESTVELEWTGRRRV